MILEYTVTGMHCAACSSSVERAVKRLNGVSAVSVSLMTEKLRVRCDSDIDKDIISAVERAGFGIEPAKSAIHSRKASILRHEAELKGQKKRLIIALIFTIPLFYIAMAHMVNLKSFPSPESPLAFAGTQLVLALCVMITGFDFYKRGIPAIIRLRPDMDSLIAISTLASFGFSVFSFVMIIKGNMDYIHSLYFESVGVIITLVMLGKYFEARAKKRTSLAVDSLLSILPDTATIINDDNRETIIPVNELVVGDRIIIKPGEAIATDGEIVSGETAIDESMLTGESLPVDKCVGDRVTAGTINTNGTIIVKTTEVGEDTVISNMVRLVDEAQNSKVHIVLLADKVCGIFVPTVSLIALIAGIIWFVIADIQTALRIFTSVLVIACPCALGLATPTAIMAATDNSATKGILIRNGEALEKACKIDIIAFDKTGTLTEGSPSVTDIIPYSIDADQLLQLFVSAEQYSEHPLGKCIVQYANEHKINTLTTTEFKAIGGKGAVMNIDGIETLAGNVTLMKEHGISEIPDVSHLEQEGKTVMFLSQNSAILGAIAVIDNIKPTTQNAIEQLKAMGIKPVIISGDNEQTVRYIASRLNIEEIYPRVLPDKKADIVKSLKGNVTAMVGDGINDAVAITVADVGFALSSGTDIACSAADVMLTRDDLGLVAQTIKVSKRTMRIIKQNLFWAFAYNCIGIPIAAGALSWLGISLSPMIAALAMCLSSITVVTNALRLRR